MSIDRAIHQISFSDHSLIREIYADAIISQGHKFYNKQQIDAWSSLAFLPGVLDKPLNEGTGWTSSENKEVAAFLIRYPLNRLALLYCRGRFSRRGHATNLLLKLELEAYKEGQDYLYTEASFFSYPLLMKIGWKVIGLQRIDIAGIGFDRYLMKKKLY